MTDAAAALSPETAPTDAQALAHRIRELEAENARLTAAASPVPALRAGGGRWRAFLSALCIVIATILVPVSIVAAWARVELVDETRFVETFAPLADDPDVQTLVSDQVTSAIDESLDLEGIADDLFDGLQQLDLPPRALAAIDLLRAPAVQGLQGLVDTTVTRLVQSDAFADVWETALRASHRSLAAVAAGGTSGGAVVIDEQGEIGIQLGPIIEEVKARLVDRGVGFASSIPVIDKTIVIAQADALRVVGTVYNLAVAAGWWTPVVTLVLFVAGVLIARRRSTAVLGTGAGIAVGSAVLAAGLSIGGSVLALSAPGLGVSTSALNAVYEQVTRAMLDTSVVLVLIGLVIAVIAWLSGRWRGARATRAGVASVNAGLRTAALSRGVDTGRVGAWLYVQRILVRVVLGALAVIWLLLLRPLTTGEVFLVMIVWLVVWWLAELVQRRPDESAPAIDDEIDTTVAASPPHGADAPRGASARGGPASTDEAAASVPAEKPTV